MTDTNIENLKQQLEVLSKMGLDTSTLQQQLDKLQANEKPVTLDNVQDVGNEPSENEPAVDIRETTPPIKAAPAIQDAEAQEKELDEDIEPSEIQKIVVAPTIEYHQCAWTLACCYLWLTSKNMNERKGVMFNTPRPFQELAHKNFLLEVPEEASWTTWNRIHSHALDNFLVSNESAAEEYTRNLKEVMCLTPHWWRDKYLANSELSMKKGGEQHGNNNPGTSIGEFRQI